MEIKLSNLTASERESQLPEGWRWATIASVAQVNPPIRQPDGADRDTEISFVPMAAVDDELGAITKPEIRKISEVWQGYKRFQNRDVIFARITPCMENGKAAIADDLVNSVACGSTEFIVIRANPNEIIPEWLYYFVRQKSFRDRAAANFTGTAGQLRVPASYIEQQEIPIPPVQQQKEIVAKIEAFYHQLRTTRAALARIPALLKALRQSVLAAAFRGELTERDPSGEPAAALLERIRSERRERWSAALHARGKDPEKYVYEEPAPVDEGSLPSLPEGWVWTRLDYLLDELQYGTSVKATANENDGVPVLRMNNIQDGSLSLENLKYIYPDAEDIPKYLLSSGDILINRTNSPELVGKAAVFRAQGEYVFASYLIKLSVIEDFIDPDYLTFVINSLIGRAHVEEVKHQVAGQANINSENIRAFPVPLTSVDEQKRIVAVLKASFDKAGTLLVAPHIALTRLDALEQAVLGKAFRGEL